MFPVGTVAIRSTSSKPRMGTSTRSKLAISHNRLTWSQFEHVPKSIFTISSIEQLKFNIMGGAGRSPLIERKYIAELPEIFRTRTVTQYICTV